MNLRPLHPTHQRVANFEVVGRLWLYGKPDVIFGLGKSKTRRRRRYNEDKYGVERTLTQIESRLERCDEFGTNNWKQNFGNGNGIW